MVLVWGTILLILAAILGGVVLFLRWALKKATVVAPAQQAPPPSQGQGYPPAGYPPPTPPRPQAHWYGAAPMVYQYPAAMVWTCPYCRFQGRPQESLKIATAGWIIFFLMLFSCVGTLFCWLPLLIRDRRVVCPSCTSAVGG